MCIVSIYDIINWWIAKTLEHWKQYSKSQSERISPGVISNNDYLEFCAMRGEEPEKPFSGKFVVRLSPEIHRKVFLKAKLSDKSLNSWVSEVLEKAVESQ